MVRSVVRRVSHYSVSPLGWRWSSLVGPGLVVCISLALLPFRNDLSLLSTAFLLLAGVIGVSLVGGVWVSTITAVVAFLCLNVLFIPPYYTLSIEAREHIIALAVFLGVALLVSQLISRLRLQTTEALRRGRESELLYQFSSALIGETSLPRLLTTMTERATTILGLTGCAVLLDSDRRHFTVGAATGDLPDLDDRGLLTMARRALTEQAPFGLGGSRARRRSPRPSGAAPQWAAPRSETRGYQLLLPLVTSSREVGVLVLNRSSGQGPFDEQEHRLLGVFAGQAAVAIERDLLAEERTRARIAERSDQLKSTLLSAVSHDLRTPLASIKMSATSLLQPGISWSPEDRDDLLHAIDEEADRMNQLITNLLDLSRVEAGELRLNADWHDAGELINLATESVATLVAGRRLLITLPPDLPMIWCDAVKIVQVFVNLLQNAAKYSPAGSAVSVSAEQAESYIVFAVADEGEGVKLGDEERVFDKFYRVDDPTRPTGAGIGLAICRGFVEAHGGRIWMTHNRPRGSVFSFSLPSGLSTPASPTDDLAVPAGHGT